MGIRSKPVALAVAALVVVAVALVGYGRGAMSGEVPRLILATTTSTEDSGLLDYLLPEFENKYRCKVDVVAVGSGQAIKLGQDGNCDVLLVHSPDAEREFVAEGYGIKRLDVMYNDFVIVGPASDPAGIRGIADAAEAFRRIAAAGARFVSRGDESGTHVKEKAVWQKLGVAPQGAWYISAGQGMGAVLNMASEQQAYTLADRGTYLAMRGNLALEILVEGDPILRNPYGVIAVNPQKHPKVKADLALKFQEWLTSVETQQRIAVFGKDRYGQPLFTPDSEAWRQAQR
jgi:tungstate transport system substrate-binding protein